MSIDDARDAILALLAHRDRHATVCPSEVARVLDEQWREAMPTVHEAVDRLVAEERVQLSWKGKMLPARAGPYRIGRRARRGTDETA